MAFRWSRPTKNQINYFIHFNMNGYYLHVVIFVWGFEGCTI